MQSYGHIDCGVYAEVLEAGALSVGRAAGAGPTSSRRGTVMPF